MQRFGKLNSFVLIIGNARSGSSLLGSVIDAHPNAIIANETSASANFWRGLSRRDILKEIRKNSENNRTHGRLSGGYEYSIQQNFTDAPNVLVMGDKVWNPAALILHGNYSLLGKLADRMDTQVKVIHAIRNPFDVIATMHFRSKAPIADRIRWYFMHCDAVCAIQEHSQDSHFMNVHHEDLIRSPDNTIVDLCNFIDVESKSYPFEPCRKLLFDTPKKTRFNHDWNASEIAEITNRMAQFEFLQKYANEDYADMLPSSPILKFPQENALGKTEADPSSVRRAA